MIKREWGRVIESEKDKETQREREWEMWRERERDRERERWRERDRERERWRERDRADNKNHGQRRDAQLVQNNIASLLMNLFNCISDGKWGEWVSADCSVTCGEGTESWSRQCNSPAPSNGGLNCSGEATNTTSCSKPGCPISKTFCKW